MTRSERLFALIQALRRHRRPVTAQKLAAELSVSVRTMRHRVEDAGLFAEPRTAAAVDRIDASVVREAITAVAQALDPSLPRERCVWWYYSRLRKEKQQKTDEVVWRGQAHPAAKWCSADRSGIPMGS